MICNVQKYRTLLFIKNKVSSNASMWKVQTQTSNFFMYGFSSQSKASYKTQVQSARFYEANTGL